MIVLPVDFEAKLKEAKQAAGGYPYSIKAEDLMKNFVHASLEVDQTESATGIRLEEYQTFGDNGHVGRGIRVASDSNSTNGGADHPWKVTAGNLAGTYNVLGGYVRTQGAFGTNGTYVYSVDGLAADDRILLKVTRDADTREITAAALGGYAASFSVTSTATDQYIHIAQVTAGEIFQEQFENIDVYEMLVVSNGSFQLLPVSMSGPNPYALPV